MDRNYGKSNYIQKQSLAQTGKLSVASQNMPDYKNKPINSNQKGLGFSERNQSKGRFGSGISKPIPNQMSSQSNNQYSNNMGNYNNINNFGGGDVFAKKPVLSSQKTKTSYIPTNYKASTISKYDRPDDNLDFISSNPSPFTNKPELGKSTKSASKIILKSGYDDNRIAISKGSKPTEMDFSGNETRIQCKGCDRKFNEVAYAKHSKICKKVFQTKRKAFDTKKKRIIDSEHAMIMRYAQSSKVDVKVKMMKEKKKDKWKAQSEEFRRILKENRIIENQAKKGYSASSKSGNKYGKTVNKNNNMGSQLNTKVQPSTNYDYVNCAYCQRNYNEESYNKHFQGCERRYKENAIKSKIAGTSKQSYGSSQVKRFK